MRMKGASYNVYLLVNLQVMVKVEIIVLLGVKINQWAKKIYWINAQRWRLTELNRLINFLECLQEIVKR